MKLQLNDYWIEHLRELPETGMGYHKVDFLCREIGLIPNVTVLNCQEADLPTIDALDLDDIIAIRPSKSND